MLVKEPPAARILPMPYRAEAIPEAAVDSNCSSFDVASGTVWDLRDRIVLFLLSGCWEHRT